MSHKNKQSRSQASQNSENSHNQASNAKGNGKNLPGSDASSNCK